MARRVESAVLALCLLGSPAMGQVAYPPPQIDTSAMATRAELGAVQQQLTQQAMVAQQDVVLDASGNATWDYSAKGFTTTPAVVHLPRAVDTANPIICNFTARTQTAVSIHCWRTTLLGLLTNLYAGSVAGATVTLVARAVP